MHEPASRHYRLLATTSRRNQHDEFSLLMAHPARRGYPGLFRDLDLALRDHKHRGSGIGLIVNNKKIYNDFSAGG